MTDDRAYLERVIRDRDDWNEHLANEVSIHILAVPSWMRGLYLRRVERLRVASTPDEVDEAQ